MKEKFKSYSFWMSVCGAVVLVINNIGNVLGFSVDESVITKIVDSICGVLVLFGVITMKNSNSQQADDAQTEQSNAQNQIAESAENADEKTQPQKDDDTKNFES